MKAAVIGLGYVGLPLALRIAELKHQVLGIDINNSKVKILKTGKLPFAEKEPKLAEVFKKVLRSKNIHFTNEFEEIASHQLIFICVDTPTIKLKPNYSSLKSALSSISKYLSKGTIVVIESTMAPKTTHKLVIPTLENLTGYRLNRDFYLAVVPERIRPNYIFKQLTTLSRVVGVSSGKIISSLEKIYTQITKGDVDFTDILTAETVKTVENTFRDVNIAFANEIAIACEELGVDAWKVRELVNKSPFHNVHMPGAGVGGHCIPKDPILLKSSVRVKMPIVSASRERNDKMPQHIFELTKAALKEANLDPKDALVSVMGFSYVKDSDDVRNSPTEQLLEIFKGKKIKYRLHDPMVESLSKKTAEDQILRTDCLILMVDHSNYKKLNLSKLSSLMRTKIIIDGRNFYSRRAAISSGFIYKGVGNV